MYRSRCHATNSRGAVAAGNPQAVDRRESVHGDSRPRAVVPLHHPRRHLDCRRRRAWPWAMPSAFAVLPRVIRDSRGGAGGHPHDGRQLSSRLGLRRVPDVLMTSRALPPLVWSLGLFPRVILPSELFARLSSEAQGTILAHELVHIRRGDYLVRLLELAATTVFWWHPVVWWASRQLRELEEQCCDGRVLELVPHQPRTYAAALVDTLEFLSERPRTPVPLRTAIYSAGSLSRRIRMLTQSRTNRLTAPECHARRRTCHPSAGRCLRRRSGQTSPAAQRQQSAGPSRDPPRSRDRRGGRTAGRRPRARGHSRRRHAVRRYQHADHKQLEAKSDANGDYRLEIPGIAGRTKISIDAMKPGYRRLVGTLMPGGDPKSVEVVPGRAAEASLILKPALYFAGIVVDEQGKPIPGVKIAANASFRPVVRRGREDREQCRMGRSNSSTIPSSRSTAATD